MPHPQRHRNSHGTSTMEPLDLPPRDHWPQPRAPRMPRQYHPRPRRRRGVVRSTGHGGFLMARNLGVFVLLLVLGTLVALFLAFAYGAPWLQDKFASGEPGTLFPTSTSAP
jgi:hypothetical protein